MSPNRTFVWKLRTIRISRELSLFNFEGLDILCPRIGHPSEKLWQLKFVESFRCSISSISTYYVPLIGPPCEKVWPFEFLESFRCSISRVSTYYAPESDIRGKGYDHLNFSRASVVQFRVSVYWCAWIGHPSEKLWPFEFLEGLLCLILSVSIYYKHESDLSVKTYDHLNFSRALVFHFLGSLYVMRMNRTSELKVRTIWISQELPLFNFASPDIL